MMFEHPLPCTKWPFPEAAVSWVSPWETNRVLWLKVPRVWSQCHATT